MIQHVYERALKSGANSVVIATDDQRIEQTALGFGAKVCMTSANHQSGTDRLAEVVDQLQLTDDEIVVNLQGDEPLIPESLLLQVATQLDQHPDAGMSTMAVRIHHAAELFDPHAVKVVMDKNGYALYFSRASIPWDRDAFSVSQDELPENHFHFRHLGLYAYRASFLREYVTWQPCSIEQMECLEQLRALWNGVRIHVSEALEVPDPGIDTEQDLQRVTAKLMEKNS